MVRHRHGDQDYWTLPGGGIESGETPQEAAIREVREETGLQVTVDRFLFSHAYAGGTCCVFLMKNLPIRQDALLGSDPEESELPMSERTLKEVAWFSLRCKADDLQVSRVLACLDKGHPE